MKLPNRWTYRRLLIAPTTPEGVALPVDLMERLDEHRFRELFTGDSMSLGWVSLDNPLSSTTSAAATYLNNDNGEVLALRLMLRLDHWAPPPAVFRARFAAACVEYALKLGKRKLNTAERDVVKRILTEEMRKESIPVMRTVPVLVHYPSSAVYVLTSSGTVADLALGQIYSLIENVELWGETSHVTRGMHAGSFHSSQVFDGVHAVEPALQGEYDAVPLASRYTRFRSSALPLDMRSQFMLWVWYQAAAKGELCGRHPGARAAESMGVLEVGPRANFIQPDGSALLKLSTRHDRPEVPRLLCKQAESQPWSLQALDLRYSTPGDNPLTWEFTLHDTTALTGVKLPVSSGQAEDDDAADIERLETAVQLERVMDALHRNFWAIRGNPAAWGAAVGDILDFLNQQST